MSPSDPPVAAPTPYFTPEAPPQNCDAKLWRLICLRVHALNDALVDALQECARLRADASRAAAPTPPQDLVRRLTEWLAAGGFFNPGPMTCANENATRELILDVREALSRVAAPTPETTELKEKS